MVGCKGGNLIFFLFQLKRQTKMKMAELRIAESMPIWSKQMLREVVTVFQKLLLAYVSRKQGRQLLQVNQRELFTHAHWRILSKNIRLPPFSFYHCMTKLIPFASTILTKREDSDQLVLLAYILHKMEIRIFLTIEVLWRLLRGKSQNWPLNAGACLIQGKLHCKVYFVIWLVLLYIQKLSQQVHDVDMTSCWRRCDLITSHRHQCDVILTLCTRWIITC